MGKPKHKTFNKENENKLHETIQQLRADKRKLEKLNKILKSENKNYKDMFEKNMNKIRELQSEKTLEEVLNMEPIKVLTPEEQAEEVAKRVASLYSTLKEENE